MRNKKAPSLNRDEAYVPWYHPVSCPLTGTLTSACLNLRMLPADDILSLSEKQFATVHHLRLFLLNYSLF